MHYVHTCIKIVLILLATVASNVYMQDDIQQINSCQGEDEIIRHFNHLSKDVLEHYCNIELDHDREDHDADNHEEDEHHEESEHHNEDEHHEEGEHHELEHEGSAEDNGNDTLCTNIYTLLREVILAVNLTTEECLEDHQHDEPHDTNTGVSHAEAYGYGLLMVIVVCLGSLLGIFIVPLIKSDSRLGRQVYEYVYAFMIALGASALVSDAILHLIPHAFSLHGHEDEDSHEHDHESNNSEPHNIDFVWKGAITLLGLYLFFLLEVVLHGLGHHLKKKTSSKPEEVQHNCATDEVHFTSDIPNNVNLKEMNKPDEKQLTINDSESSTEVDIRAIKICDLSCRRIKPVAWLIIIGDAVHNFADGLALGAAISQSVALGLSTMFAIIFHEIPHELGDYAILIKSGLHWITALGFNALSSLSAIIGLLVGVAISGHREVANEWILAGAAGFFLYISLTDLLPELIHNEGKIQETKNGLKFAIRFTLANAGLIISFVILLLLAVYEERLAELI